MDDITQLLEQAEQEEQARHKALLEGFESILERYDMPKQADWERLKYWLEEAEGNPVDIMDLKWGGLEYIDWVELIRLIKLLESSESVEVSSPSKIKVSLNDSNTHKYLLLSLHKLLYQCLETNYRSNKDSDTLTIWRFGKVYELQKKKPLGGADSDFYEPFSSEELDKLLEMEMRLKAFEKKARGKGKYYAPLLGDRVAEVLEYIPEEALAGKSKTDILNFAGEIMELGNILYVAPQWEALSKELAEAEGKGWIVGDLRRQRQKMLMYWLKSGKALFCKGDSSLYCNEDNCDWYPVCKGAIQKVIKI